jgi:2Fe-2S ferredoxin
MAKITYIQPDGTSETLDVPIGSSVMEGAVKNGVAGIEADCGGACACATCHVKVSPEWTAIVGPPGEIEADMLDGAVDVDERSRLSCQIELTAELDGLVVEVAATQR